MTPILPVVLAGGSGTRLWPLSRTHFPKQYLPLIGGRSLFVLTLERARRLGCAKFIVVCNEAHRFFALEGLRAAGIAAADGRVVVEPVPRNTAPALALAALALAEQGGGTLLVLPSDHHIADEDDGPLSFAGRLDAAAAAAARGALVTFGIRPTRAETGYGYIVAGRDAGDGVHVVLEFAEKPPPVQAREYAAREDCYWNSGVFLFDAKTCLAELARHQPALLAACTEAWRERRRDDVAGACIERVGAREFGASPDISIDYAVMEKTRAAVVVPVAADWSDLGSWEACAALGDHDAAGNAMTGDVVSQDARDNVVYSSGRLVAVVGVHGQVVVETPDAVLVADRASGQALKQLVTGLRQAHRAEGDWHRKVYRPWGSFERVDGGQGFQVKRLIINPGQRLSLQSHRRRSEHWVVVRGVARVTLGDAVLTLAPNQSVCIPVGVKHRLENRGDEALHLIEVQCGDYLGEDDIERFEDAYGRTAEP